MRDLSGLEAASIEPMENSPEDELLPHKKAELDFRTPEVHLPGPTEIRSQRALDGAAVDIHPDPRGSHAKRASFKVRFLRERADRVEISGDELSGHEVRESKTTDGGLDGSGSVHPHEPRPENERADFDPLRGHRGEGLGPREGRVLAGQLDDRAHGLRTVPRDMSLPPTVILKCPGLFARLVRIRPFVPNDLPAIATIVRDALRENYPTSLYLDIHRWWRDGFLVADLDGHPVGFLASVISADGQARILMFAVSTPFRRRGFGSLMMNAFVQSCAMRGIKRIELEVRVSNVDAIGFYKRYGFEILAILPHFYTDGEDGYKMMRQL